MVVVWGVVWCCGVVWCGVVGLWRWCSGGSGGGNSGGNGGDGVGGGGSGGGDLGGGGGDVGGSGGGGGVEKIMPMMLVEFYTTILNKLRVIKMYIYYYLINLLFFYLN